MIGKYRSNRDILKYYMINSFVDGGGEGTRWSSWLRHCTTSWKVAGSIPDGVIRVFH
jgi:hypothetical protein